VPPSPEHLRQLAQLLDAKASDLESKAFESRTGRGRAVLKEEERLKRECGRALHVLCLTAAHEPRRKLMDYARNSLYSASCLPPLVCCCARSGAPAPPCGRRARRLRQAHAAVGQGGSRRGAAGAAGGRAGSSGSGRRIAVAAGAAAHGPRVLARVRAAAHARAGGPGRAQPAVAGARGDGQGRRAPARGRRRGQRQRQWGQRQRGGGRGVGAQPQDAPRPLGPAQGLRPAVRAAALALPARHVRGGGRCA
jgi:hypothetical protein